DAATGKFNGTPDAAATLTLKVTATDQAKATMSNEFVLLIAAVPVSNPISDPVPVSFDGDAGVIPSTSFEKITKRIQGTPKSDKLTGSDANDLLNGKSKNDRLKGQGGDDWLIGGKGDDRLNGGSGNDRMDGSQGQDQLLGGKGDDRLLGGLGKDTLIGGGGNDVYVFNNNLAFNTDVIIGFEAASELIDLRPIFAKAGYQGATLAQVVRLEQIGSNTQIQIDTDGLGSGTSLAAIATLQNVAVGAIGSRNFVIS
ncbi:MAG TPA: type I secretion C-terminal target domain-containing protein, partial [Allocoleopsis sp.]